MTHPWWALSDEERAERIAAVRARQPGSHPYALPVWHTPTERIPDDGRDLLPTKGEIAAKRKRALERTQEDWLLLIKRQEP